MCFFNKLLKKWNMKNEENVDLIFYDLHWRIKSKDKEDHALETGPSFRK